MLGGPKEVEGEEANNVVDITGRLATRGVFPVQESDALVAPANLHANIEASQNHPAVEPQKIDRDFEAIQQIAGFELDKGKLEDELKGFFRTISGLNQMGFEMKFPWPDDGGVTDFNEAVRRILEQSRKPEQTPEE
jgi:hypothetical protein